MLGVWGLALSLSPLLVGLFLFFLILLSQIHGLRSIDLKSMHTENSRNVVPLTLTHQIVLPSDFAVSVQKYWESHFSFSCIAGKVILVLLNYAMKLWDEVTLGQWGAWPPPRPRKSHEGASVEENMSCRRFMVVFQYGSAVLFNVEDHEVEFYLEIVRRHASVLLPEMRKDDYAVKEKPLLVEDMQGGPDFIVLKNLDADSIRIIGSVLGQSIALDYFVSQIDGMVEEFTDINRGMEKTGTFTVDRKKLFQLVGTANSNLADVILKVGLFESILLVNLLPRHVAVWGLSVVFHGCMQTCL
ncbi:Sad1-interacting factor like [Actinidia chinensis var. chinensis]|uniref:Sad1-interacting factor like n=1 Tax=Actinidia chinensis var. chinensis TaxID=1590841 RepID=A0A2R6PBR0_ACTCC|nr:Sad1-interacting factor like [Actinidia chinensis var. chinensis]